MGESQVQWMEETLISTHGKRIGVVNTLLICPVPSLKSKVFIPLAARNTECCQYLGRGETLLP